MMAGLMLVFALIMVFSVYQFAALQETKRIELTEKENLLIAKEDELATKQVELDEEKETSAEQDAKLQAQQTTLDEQSAQLTAAIAAQAAQQLELEEKTAQLEAATAAQATQQLALDAKDTQLSAQQALMDSQQQRIDALVGVRTQIIESLSEELRGANLNVVVDEQTGAITLKGAVLFDVNESALKVGGMDLLESFIPVYVRTLLKGGNKDYVAEIIIEGHTDTDGPFLVNLMLSQERAYAVAQYCLQDGFGGLTAEERDLLRTIVTANGRSWSNPVLNADGTVNKDASRRVEFKFRLKEAEMINEMRVIMESQLATPAPAPQ